MPKRIKTEEAKKVNWLNNWLYEAIYSESPGFPFTIHNKKLEEAESLFEASITAKQHSKTLIAVKGPTGCGKGFLYAHLKNKYGHLAHFTEFDSQDHPEVDYFQQPFQIQCSTSIFPALQFSLINSPVKKPSSFEPPNVSVMRLTDAHFQVKEVRRMVDQLKSFGGVLLVEFTESDFEDSTSFLALKLLKEAFSNRFFTLNLNSCARQLMRKSLTPIAAAYPGDLNAVMEKSFKGDVRAFLHDLFMATLTCSTSYSFPSRDYRTDFFHYIGKLLYPAKTEARVFDEESFWDLDFEGVLLFVQYYLTLFCQRIEKLSTALDALSVFDSISWKVKHPCNSLTYSTIFTVYTVINSDLPTKNRSMFSFSKPPSVNSRRIRHSDEQFIIEQIKNSQLSL